MKTMLLLACALFTTTALLAPAQQIIIKGSNTFGEELGPHLIADFAKRKPGIKVELESSSSGAGIAALLNGECDIATASRVANEDELRLAKSRVIKMKQYTVGYYGIAVIVNHDLGIKGLSDAHARDIFTGKIKNWNAVGGPDAPIRIFIREAASGTYLGFQELVMERQPYSTSAKQLASYPEILKAVHSEPNGIGFVGMPLAHEPGVRAIRINGIPPTATAVGQDLYPYARLLRMYTNEDKESRATREFIRYVQSRRGQDIVDELGFVPRISRGLWGGSL